MKKYQWDILLLQIRWGMIGFLMFQALLWFVNTLGVKPVIGYPGMCVGLCMIMLTYMLDKNR